MKEMMMMKRQKIMKKDDEEERFNNFLWKRRARFSSSFPILLNDSREAKKKKVNYSLEVRTCAPHFCVRQVAGYTDGWTAMDDMYHKRALFQKLFFNISLFVFYIDMWKCLRFI